MSRIVYMLGAGASYGTRGDKKIDFRTEIPTKDCVLSDGGSCVDITSGVPVVTEIPGRLAHMLHRLCNLYNDKQCPLNVSLRLKTT